MHYIKMIASHIISYHKLTDYNNYIYAIANECSHLNHQQQKNLVEVTYTCTWWWSSMLIIIFISSNRRKKKKWYEDVYTYLHNIIFVAKQKLGMHIHIIITDRISVLLLDYKFTFLASQELLYHIVFLSTRTRSVITMTMSTLHGIIN